MSTELNNKLKPLEEQYLSDEAVDEFDSILKEYERPLRRRRALRWTGGIAAAAALTLILARPWVPREEQINPMVIAEGIEHLMDLSPDEIVCIEAVPKGSKAFLTAKMKDGSIRSFIMTVDDDGRSFKIASNEN